MEKCMNDPNRDCLCVVKAEQLEKELESMRSHARETHSQMYTRIRNMEIAQAETKTEYGHIMEMLGGLKSDIKGIKERPAKRWEGMVDKALWLVVGAVLAYAITGIGLPV